MDINLNRNDKKDSTTLLNKCFNANKQPANHSSIQQTQGYPTELTPSSLRRQLLQPFIPPLILRQLLLLRRR